MPASSASTRRLARPIPSSSPNWSQPILTRLDHVGVIAHSLDEASQVLVARLGFELDLVRAPLPDGGYFAPERTQIFFIKIGAGETRIEILLPEDTKSGIGRCLRKRGASMHHLC